MNCKMNKRATIWSCIALASLSASAFDGGTNTIPDGASYTELNIGTDISNTVVSLTNGTATVSKFVRLGANDSSTNNFFKIEDGATLEIGTLNAPSNDGIVIGNTVGDSMIIKNASMVESSKLTMGAAEGETSRISIKGTDSTLLVTQDTSIGALGDNNEINVTGGGKFEVRGLLSVGSTNTVDNKIEIDRESTLSVTGLDKVNIAEGNAVVVNGTLQAKGDVSTSALDASKVSFNSGSKVLVDDTLIDDIENGYAIVLNESATWDTQGGDARIGFSTSGNSLTINNETDITITNTLTAGDESDRNQLNIQDDAILAAKTLNIGQSGSSNTLNIENNAQLNVTNGTISVGVSKTAQSNKVYLKDDATLNASSITIGSAGKNNEYIQSGGTATVTSKMHIGEGSGADGNKLKITGGSLSVSDLNLGADGNKGNTASVSGDDASLIVQNMLTIGSATSSNNTVTVRDGGTLQVKQGNIAIGSTNNSLTVADGGILKTLGWDFETQTGLATNILFKSGSTLHMQGDLMGTNMVEGGRNFVLDGTNSSWTTTTNMFVGYGINNNSLTLTNGATATTTTNLYIGFASAYNNVNITGTNSSLDIGSDLYIGTSTNSSEGNSLYVLNGAQVSVGNDAYLYRASTLKIDSKSQVSITGNYEQDKFSTLEVGVSSNQVQPNLVVGGSANFYNDTSTTNYPMLKVFDDGIAESNVVTIVQASDISINDKEATTTLIRDNVQTNLLLDFKVSISNDVNQNMLIVLDDFIKHSLKDAADLDGMLADISDEIEALAANTNEFAQAMLKQFQDGMTDQEANQAMHNYYGEKASSIPANNAINLGIQNVAEQLTMRADNTRSRRGMATSQASFDKPEGTSGPHQSGQELQGWVSFYGSKGSMDAAGGFSQYDSSLSGFLIGADMAYNDNILFGLAGGSGSSSLDKGDADIDTKTIYGSAYASIGTEDWFTDINLIYGNSDVDATLGSTFDTTADYSAYNMALYMGGGKEISGDYLIFTPQASFLANYYAQYSYEEESSDAVARKVYSFNQFYFQSSLGASLAMYTSAGEVTFKPEISAYWLHEWNAKEEDLDFRLQGGSNRYTMQLQAPEQDILKLGIGSSAKVGEYLELRADLNTRLGKDYSDYTLLGSLRYQF